MKFKVPILIYTPKTEPGSHSTHQVPHDSQHQSSTTSSNLSSPSSSTTTSSSHLKNSNLVIKDDSRLRAQSPHCSNNNNTTTNSNISGSQISSNNQLTTSSISLSTTTTTTAVALLSSSTTSSSTLSSSVHNSNNSSTNISGNNSSNNNNNNNNSGSTPSLYVSVPLSTANVPGVNIPSNASNGSASGTGGGGVSLSNVSSSSINSAGNTAGGKQSPRISGGFPSTNQQQHSTSSLIASDHSKPIVSGSSSSAAIQSSSSVIQPIVSPLGSTNSNLSASNESVNLTIKYEKQPNFRVSKVQEQESGPARRSRTPDSGNYSNTSLSQASLSTSTSSLNNGGLKFSYEPQMNCGTQSSALSPPLIDTNIGAVIKDSPQSSPSSESGSTLSRKRGRKSGEARNNTTSASSNNGPIPMVLDSKSDCIKQENKILQNGTGTNITTNSSSSSNSLNTAHHMLGNQINPSSSMAQKMSDMVHMEIQDHSIYSQDNGPQLIGVPFPGKRVTPTNHNTPNSSTNSLTSMLTGTATSTPSGNTPQSLEQLLERQWEQGSQFLMEQAQHFDIASLLSCLHQLRTENIRLEEHVNSLIARRDHLLAVNARLAIPLTSNNTQNQVTAKKRRS